MSSFLKVDLRLVIDDGRNSNQKTFFDLREIDDDLESLYQTRAKEWFPFSLTMKVPGLDPHQTVQVFLGSVATLSEAWWRLARWPRGDSHIKVTGVIVGNFEMNP